MCPHLPRLGDKKSSPAAPAPPPCHGLVAGRVGMQGACDTRAIPPLGLMSSPEATRRCLLGRPAKGHAAMATGRSSQSHALSSHEEAAKTRTGRVAQLSNRSPGTRLGGQEERVAVSKGSLASAGRPGGVHAPPGGVRLRGRALPRRACGGARKATCFSFLGAEAFAPRGRPPPPPCFLLPGLAGLHGRPCRPVEPLAHAPEPQPRRYTHSLALTRL